MKTVKELIRKYLIHCAETSMHSPSRAGNYQEDMRKLKKERNKENIETGKTRRQ